MKAILRWLCRAVFRVGAVCVLLVLFLALFGRTLLTHVTESNGYVSVNGASVATTLCGSFPKSATAIRSCTGSVGLQGRLLAYRFSAPVDDLHVHAQKEFAAHWDSVTFKRTQNSRSPITEHDIDGIRSYGVEADWMLPPSDAVGTVYESTDGMHSHRPTIFVDERNRTLYFIMTD